MTINAKQDRAQFTDEARQLGHFSKYVHPGALHITASSANSYGIEYVAFQNPDRILAIVMHNSSSHVQTLTVQALDRTAFTTSLPAGAFATYTWASTTTR